ncbi:MAG: DUF4179 domain-containing protein [Clostridia bacterium]|nr:DUF4179 domain-containing protein [Clostridia bacterium]
MDELDKKIISVINSNICEPNGYQATIKQALYIKKKNANFYKVAIIIICCSIFISSVAYASYYIKNMFNNREGVETAINNNYIINGSGEYQTSNNISIKANNILMDDYNLDINFDVKCEEELDIHNIEFQSILITDEENRIIYAKGSKILTEFIEKNKLNIEEGNFNEKYINSGASSKVHNTQKGKVQLIYNLTTDTMKYPKSKKIFCRLENIVIDNQLYKGIWCIEENMPDSFQNRQTYTYQIVDNTYEEIKEIKMETYITGTNISIILEKNNDNNEEILRILKELEKENSSNEVAKTEEYEGHLVSKAYKEYMMLINPINNVYIENSNKERFYITKNTSANGELLGEEKDGILKYTDTLDLTIYDSTDTLTLHFEYNKKQYDIRLIRNQ